MTSGWLWAPNELWQDLAQNKPAVDVSDRSQSWLLQAPFCCSLLQTRQPPTQHGTWAEGASWRPFCRLTFGNKSWADGDILKGNCILFLWLSGHKFRWRAHLLVSKIHSFPSDDEWLINAQSLGDPGARSYSCSSNRGKVKTNLKIGREPG